MVYLDRLYSRVKEDGTKIADIGEDLVRALREKMQSLSGTGGPDLTDIPTADILLTLRRQQRRIHTEQQTASSPVLEGSGGSYPGDLRPRGTHPPTLNSMEQGFFCGNILS
ncbi:hypothetical protein BBP40_001634 [Aspergillus hancockii]|nr:hypothetical protein BBP40_001634 [Aspergillus hancockii]